jgi:hypothetical protein
MHIYLKATIQPAIGVVSRKKIYEISRNLVEAIFTEAIPMLNILEACEWCSVWKDH